MPIYEYQCKKCGEFEIMRKITDKSLTRCPTCRGKVTKLMSSTSFQLKGTGWYATDYGRKDSKREGSGGNSEAKTETTSETKSEAKAETKSDSKSEGKKDGASTESKGTKSPEAAAA